MLVVHKVGLRQADYYLDERCQGRWAGAGCADLGLGGRVERPALVAALSGCDLDGRLLLGRRSPRRRAGFDLIFGAPKSVSLLAGLTGGLDGPSDRLTAPFVRPGRWPDMATLGAVIVAAHDTAVCDTLGYLERRATWTRRGSTHARIPTSGLIAAGFRHGFSWSGDPHLHTHVVVANLVLGADTTWSCLDSRSVYNHRRAATAVYQASLRHQLDRAGFALRWTVRPDGLADIVGVPRTAIEACSSRRLAILEDDDGFMPPTEAARRAAAGRTRRRHQRPTDSWEARAAASGLDGNLAASILVPATSARGDVTIPDGLEVTIDGRISATMSSFEHSDCVRLGAAHLPQGAPAEVIETWATRFMDHAVREDDRRSVTPLLRQRGQQLADLVTRLSTRTGLARPATIARALADRPGLDEVARLAVETLTSSGACVERLGYGPFLGQAAVIEAAHEAWAASGHRVAVIAPTDRARSRWRAVAGLEAPPALPYHASVIIVDNADRLCTAALHSVVADGTSRQAKIVLVEGGTGPAPRPSAEPAYAQLRALLPAVDTGSANVRPRASAPVRGGLGDSVAVATRTHDALNAVVADWAAARYGPRPAVMVALGPEEAGALNALARQWLAAEGVLRGPAVGAGSKEWRAGDELRVLRRHRLFGQAMPGTLGTVTAVDPAAKAVTIGWRSGPMTVSADDLSRAPVTYAYATTPPYLRYWTGGRVLSLGDPGRRQLEPSDLYLVAHPPGSGQIPSGAVARMVTELSAIRAVPGTPAPPRRQAGTPDTPAPPRRQAGGSRREDGTKRYEAWSLGRLDEMRTALADRLEASAPPDVGPEQRMLAEERAWQQARGQPSEVLERRSQTLAAAAEARRQWLEGHAEELADWVSLGEAMTRRADLLTVAAETRPSLTVQAELGPAPQDEPAKTEWRRAAKVLESYRDRWGLADDPHQLHPAMAAEGSDRARRNDLVRAVTAGRSNSHGPGLGRGPPRTTPTSAVYRSMSNIGTDWRGELSE